MANEGGLLYISIDGPACCYRCDPKDGYHLSFTTDPKAPFKRLLNDRLVSPCVFDDPIVWKWILDCDVRALQHLRSLYFSVDVGSLNLALLKKIAVARPYIRLSFDVVEA